MAAPKGKRIYCQLNNDYAIESPYVKYSTGEKSFQPVTEPKIVLLSVVKAEGYPLVTATEGVEMFKESAYVQPTKAPVVAPECACDDKSTKEVQYPVSVDANTAEVGVIRTGLHDEGYSIFGAAVTKETAVAITGKFGADALKVLGQLAQHGKIKINRIHAEASDPAVFNNELLLKEVEFNGRCLADKEFYWEKSKSQDENLQVRDIYFKESEVVLNGKNYLEMNIPSGEKVDLTFYIEHMK